MLKYAHLYYVLFVNPESRPNFLLSHMASARCFGDIVCHDLRRRNEIRKRFDNIKRTIAGFVATAAATGVDFVVVVVVVVLVVLVLVVVLVAVVVVVAAAGVVVVVVAVFDS